MQTPYGIEVGVGKWHDSVLVGAGIKEVGGMEAHGVVAAVGKGGIVMDKGGTAIFAAVACVVA